MEKGRSELTGGVWCGGGGYYGLLRPACPVRQGFEKLRFAGFFWVITGRAWRAVGGRLRGWGKRKV